MIPILWRYLFRSYFKSFFLSVGAFVSVLVVMRLQEIARFATSGANFSKTLLFAVLQIPYILPIAIPISCLITTLLLIRRLSQSQELTALRASGLGIKQIRTPLLYLGACIALLNFTIASEVTPACRSLSKGLIFEVVRDNPLFPLQRDSLVKLKNAYYHIDRLEGSKKAHDVLIVGKNHSNNAMTLLLAKNLQVDNGIVKGKDVSLISSVESKKESAPLDHLAIENQAEMQTESSQLSQFMQKPDWKGSVDYFPLRYLLAHILEKVEIKTSLKGSVMELIRRLSIGLAPFTLTLLGASSGLEIGRERSKKGILLATLMTALFLSCFIAAKSFYSTPLIATTIFLVPHLLLLIVSTHNLRKVQRGIV